MRDLPAPVRATANGAGAEAWLTELPGLIADLAREWELRPGAAFGDATEAYVVSVTQRDGTPAVLKLVVPRRHGAPARKESTVLRVAAGAGCCRLLRYDESRSALLLEQLGPSMSTLDLPQPRRLEILCDLASAVWRRSEADLPTGEQQAELLIDKTRSLWTELGRPCGRRAVEDALAAAESRRRAWDPDRAVLSHGDVHQWNALRSGDGFKLVDPDGVRAEPELDLGVLMREDPDELFTGDPRDRARWLAARTGTDPQAIWEWGLVERVCCGLVLSARGVQPFGARMLAAADRISAT